jgi:acetyl esterase/lipase
MPTPRQAAAAFVLALGALLAAGQQAHAQCQTVSGLTYATYVDGGGKTQPLLLDLLLPSGVAAPLPLVIWIHGGGWSSGSRTPIPEGPTGLCSRGYAVASLDYRLFPSWSWPVPLHDVKGAVRWLRAHAGDYNLDPDRFGAWGASAGAQLAAMLGTAGDVGIVTIGNLTVDLEGTVGGNTGFSSRVQAVTDWYGPTDFLQMRFYPTTNSHDAASSDESHLLGGPIQGLPERAASADAITFVTPDDAPFLVMHGTLDDIYPINQSELLVDALRAMSVPVSFVPVPNAGHGGTAFTTSANHQTVYNFFDAFLKNLGAPAVSVTAAADASEAGTAGRFTISRTGSTAAPLTVRWALAGTATAGSDFTAPVESATIPAGAASVNVNVTPVADSLVEGDETIELHLAFDPAYRIDDAKSAAQITLTDNDGSPSLPVVTLQATDAAAAETGPDAGTLTVSVAGSFAGSLTVRYTVAGTAENGADYAPLSGAVTIPAGQTAATIVIDPVADGGLETAETVFVALAPAAGYAIGAPAAAGVVLADVDLDTTKPILSVSATDPTAAEPGGDAGAFTVTRTGSTSSSLAIEIALGGSAQNGGDYGHLQRFPTFAPGAGRMVVSIAPLDDPDIEGTEDVTLAVPAGAAWQLGPYAGSRVTLLDNEPSSGVEGFYPLPPCRLVDTRRPAGLWGAPTLATGETRIFPVSGSCGVPPDATALSVNITAIAPAANGFLTLFEPGAPRPTASTINVRTGETRANNGIVHLIGHPRAIALYSGVPVEVAVDVNGYFK